MRYLSSTAAEVYLRISKRSFLCGHIGWSQLLARLSALRELSAPSSRVSIHAQRILQLEDELVDDDWPEGASSKAESRDDQKWSTVMTEHGSADDDDDDHLLFLPSGNTGLAQWQFHLYDDDPFPAVPHGHCKRNKLDPYLGWTYERVRQNGREPRWKIVALWNDRKFRAAALVAIDYYMLHHQHHDWRVDNPRRLPRRR